MIIKKFHIVLGLLIIIFTSKAEYSQNDNEVDILFGGDLYLWTDTNKSISINTLLKHPNSFPFKKSAAKVPSFWMSNHAHWLKFSVDLTTTNPKYIELFTKKSENEVLFYLVDSSGAIIHQYQILKYSPLKDRPLKSYKKIFPVPVSKNGNYTCYIRIIHNEGTVKFAIVKRTPQSFAQYEKNTNLHFGFFIAVYVLITILASTLFYFLKEIKYGYYAVFVLFTGIWQLWVEGLFANHLSDVCPWIVNSNPSIFATLTSIILMLLFHKEYIITPNIKLHKYIIHYKILISLFIVTIITVVFGIKIDTFKSVAGLLYYILGLISLLFTTSLTIVAAKQKSRNALFFLVSEIPKMVYMLAVGLTNSGILKLNVLFFYNLEWFLLFEMIILLIGLGYELNQIVTHRRNLLIESHQKEQIILETKTKLQEELIYRLQSEEKIKSANEKLSRDLHDGLGSEISNIIHNLDYISQLNKHKKYDDLQLNLEELQKYTRSSLQHLRGGIWVLHNPNIALEQLLNKLHSFALDQLGYSHNSEFIVEIDNSLKKIILPPNYALNLYRASQEAINNAIKYSKATRIGIKIIPKNASIVEYNIYDNGIGMELTNALKKDSYGLKNIYQRIRAIGENVEIKSTANQGTEIIITLLKLNQHE